MKKIVLVTTAILALSGCSQPKPTTENAATALESDLVNRAAALENEVNADTSAAAANAMNGAGATYNGSIESDAANNGN